MPTPVRPLAAQVDPGATPQLTVTMIEAVGASVALGAQGPPLRIRRSTFFGRVSTRELVLASEALFTAPLDVDYHQDGCVRYSYVPAGARTPRRFRSQPDLALAEALAGVDEPGWAGLPVPPYRIRRDQNAPCLETQDAEGGDFRCICATQSLPFSVERRLSVVLKRNIQGACP